MSSILRTTALRTSTIFRTTSAAATVARPISTSPALHKSVTEAVKDAVKAVDKTAANVAVKGLETAEVITEKTKKTFGTTRGTMSEQASQAAGKAQEMTGSAKGTKEEMKGTLKGKANEFAGKVKGAMNEATKP